MTSEHSSGVSERTRLLPAAQDDDGHGNDNINSNRNRSSSSSTVSENIGDQVSISHRITIATLCLLLLVVVEFAATILSISISQIQEEILCHRFYPDVDNTTTDPRCKNENVQSELSIVQGWGFTFAIIPSIITAVPYGVAADKYGRRVILSLSILGAMLVEAVGVVICKWTALIKTRKYRPTKCLFPRSISSSLPTPLGVACFHIYLGRWRPICLQRHDFHHCQRCCNRGAAVRNGN